MKFCYRLSKEEIEDAVFCAEWKKQRKFHGKHLWITSMLGVCVLLEYMCNPEKLYLAFVLAVIVAMLFYLVYAPVISRKRKARDLFKLNGEYQLEIQQDHIIGGSGNNKISFRDKELEAVYTEKVYVLQIGEGWYAIPRNQINEEQEKYLIEILNKYDCQITKLVKKQSRKGRKGEEKI